MFSMDFLLFADPKARLESLAKKKANAKLWQVIYYFLKNNVES